MVVQNLTVPEARASIEKANLRASDVKADGLLGRIGIVDKDAAVVKVGDQTLAVAPYAYRSLFSQLGVNVKVVAEYADDSDLVKRMIDYALNKRAGKDVRLVHSTDTLFGIERKPDTAWVPPTEVFDAVVEGMDNAGGVAGVNEMVFHNDNRGVMGIRLLSKEVGHPAKDVGDISHAGLDVRMNGNVEIAPFVFRLVCTNGMVGEHQVASRFSVETKDMAAFRDDVIKATGEAVSSLRDFACLAEKKVERPAEIIGSLSRNYGMRPAHIEELVSRVPSLPEQATAYDVVNLITSYANDVKNVRQRHSLQAIGFQFLGALKDDHRCTRCAAVLK